ncbi:MAG: SdiA-regulated domain-containing protein [Myxococcaceae bacterium]|nr:SdiA-regulated domain-containing protein [Myxococcaceae bacterium]
MSHKVGWGPRVDGGSSKPAKSEKAEFKRGGKTKVDVKEASDVVSLGQGRFLVVGDQSNKLAVVGADGKTTRVELGDVKNGKSGFEGVAYDARNHKLYVSREEQGKVLRYGWDPDAGQPPKLEKTIALELDGPKNKGIEGLAFLPGDVSPGGRPQLLAAKEGKPRELLLMGADGSDKPKKVDLEAQVRSVCRDFSALAVDPKSGHVFISSDESSTVAEIELVQKNGTLEGRLVQSFPLRDKKDKPLDRVEGLTFDEKGNLHVLTENADELLELERQ